MDRVRKFKLLLWVAVGVAAAVATARFLFGLGAATNLSDSNPWGLWIGFDVMSGVALAAGGFIVTTIVYIFRLEKFHSIVRPAVLTAFLGYLAVAVSLLFDLGLPWNIWHLIVFWNPHSPLFEVGWCVMLYLTVLALEFFPVPAEDISVLANIRRFLIKVRLPLVLAGIGLSTLHQSSLGSLFLIMPYRVHPLWYSPILPVLFFLSAIALGLMMVTCESHFSAYLYRRKPETELLAQIAGAARWVLLAYVLVRFGDLLLRGQAAHLFSGEWQVKMFWLEIAMVAMVPGVMLSIPRIRNLRAGQWTAAGLCITGIVMNRVDVGGFTHIRPAGTFYVPAWNEIAVSAGIVSAMALLFLFAIERFKVWEQRPADPDAEALKLPEFDRVGDTWLGIPALAARTTYSLAFVVAAALAFAALAGQPAASRGIDPTPVHQARGGEILWIDGNLDGYGVAFQHEQHESREGGKASCVKCHHMNLPRDRNSACSRCHSDMYLAVDAFRHDWHASPAGGRIGCYQCHPSGQVRTANNAVRCDRCHRDLVPAGSTVQVKTYRAVSYTESMHRLCVGCHVKNAAAKSKPEMARCAWCHKERRPVVDAGDVAFQGEGLLGRSIILPPGMKQKMTPEITQTELDRLLGRGLFDHVPFNVAVIDRDFRVVAANRGFEEYFGNWQNRRCYEVCKGSPQPCTRCRARETFGDGRVRVSDETGFDRHGRSCHYVVHLAPLRDEDGRVKYILEMTTDLTETRHWQREYDLFFERVPCYVLIVDRNFRVVRSNEKFRQAFGEVHGKLCYQVCKRRTMPCRNCPAMLAFADGKEHTSNQVGVHQDGSPAHYVVTSSPLSRGEDGIAHVIEMATDITPLRRLESEMKEAQDIYESLIRNSPAGILAMDAFGNAKIMNPAARQLLEWTSKQPPAENRLKQMLPTEFFGSEAKEDQPLNLPEVLLRSTHGREVPVRFSALALKSHGKRIGYAAFMEDLREIKRLEAEMLEAERLGAVGQTVAGLAHTIKNLLMGLEGGMYMVDSGLRRGDVARITSGWGILQRNFEKTTTLVKGFLDFAKGRLPEPRPTDPNALARDIVELYREAARQQGVELVLEAGQEVREAPLDPGAMETCLTNLISNAVDASAIRRGGGGRVVLRTREESGDLTFEVNDNGCGMDSEVKGKVFTTFFTTKGGKGTGLGLLTTSKIVQEHGGRIEVESNPGEGSTFRMRLPRQRLQAVADRAAAAQRTEQVKS